MPIYEYLCNGCSKVTSLFVRQYAPPSQAQCEHCQSTDTKLTISQVAFRVAIKSKYSTDFMEKSLPFLKSRKEFKKEFEENPKESEESKAFKLSEKIGEGIDHMIEQHFANK